VLTSDAKSLFFNVLSQSLLSRSYKTL